MQPIVELARGTEEVLQPLPSKQDYTGVLVDQHALPIYTAERQNTDEPALKWQDIPVNKKLQSSYQSFTTLRDQC